MSTKAIDEVVNELKGLPESDQKLFLSFVKDFKMQRAATSEAKRQSHSPALKMIDGILVHTGILLDQTTDWLEVVRREREDELIRQALGHSPAQ